MDASIACEKGGGFPAPTSEQVVVKGINHYGDEAMKVFRVL